MTQRHGKATKVLYAGYDLSGDLNQADRAETVDSAQVDVFGLGNHAFLAGMRNGTLSWNFIYAQAAIAPFENLDDILTVDIGTQGDQAIVIPYNVFGGRGWGAVSAIPTAYALNSSISEAVKGTATLQASGGLLGGTVLHALTAEVADNAGTVYHDETAAASFQTNGAVLFLMITAIDDDLDVVVEHSLDHVTWTTLGTFATQDVIGGQIIRVAAGTTIKRYRRITWDQDGASVTFAVLLCPLAN